MKKHTCHLDLHQRSHYDTITIGPEEMMNWDLQLNNSQLCLHLQKDSQQDVGLFLGPGSEKKRFSTHDSKP